MKNTFGKGLESLIPKKIGVFKDPSSGGKEEAVFSIEVDKIKSNPYQPRKDFDQKALRVLADSILDYGVLQPLLVTRIEKAPGQVEYQLIAGERRLLAAKMAGLAQVPVIIRQPNEKEKLAISLIENVQRLDLNPLEKAEAYKKLQKEFNFLQKDIAKLVGKSREAVANTLRLLELPEEIKYGLKEGKISEGHARAMLAIQNTQKQKTLYLKTLRDGLNVREVENLVQKLNIWQPAKKISQDFKENLEELENKIREIFEIKTLKLRFEAGRPKLTIFFNTKKEIENLIKRLSQKL